MGKKLENLENFKKAITSTIKSIIGDPTIDVTFGNEITKKNVNILVTSDRFYRRSDCFFKIF